MIKPWHTNMQEKWILREDHLKV